MARTHTFKIQPADSLADVRSLASIFARTFKNDEWFQWLYAPRINLVDSSERKLVEEEALRQAEATMIRFTLNPTSHSFLVHDKQTEQIIAFAQWSAPKADASQQLRKLGFKAHLLRIGYAAYDWLVSILVPFAAARKVLGLTTLATEVIMRHKKWDIHLSNAESAYVRPEHKKQGYWKLSLLGVLPEFGRKGVATELLQWGMQKADEEDRAIYISASPPGTGAYKKSGFKVVGADLCYPADPQGGWYETVLVRERISDRLAADK